MYENLYLLRKLHLCEKWSEDQSTLTWVYLAVMGATDPNKASLSRKIVTFYYCEI